MYSSATIQEQIILKQKCSAYKNKGHGSEERVIGVIVMSSNFSCFSPNLSADISTPRAWNVDFYGVGPVRNVNVIAAFLLLFFVLGVPWNMLVLVCVLKKRLYMQPGIILLLNLTVTDLLLCVLVFPFNIVSGIAGRFVFGESDSVRCMVCQTGIFMTLLTFVSFHTVTLMSIDRLLYLLKPMKYSSMVTPRRTLMVIAIVWVVCGVLASMPIFKFGEMEFGLVIGTCALLLIGSGQTQTNKYYTLLLLAEISVALLLLIAANFAILLVVKRHIRKARNLRKSELNLTENTNLQGKSNQIQLYLLRMLGAILLTNFVVLLPMIVLAITGVATTFDKVPQPYISFSYIVFMSQAVVHPFLESIFVKEIASLLPNCKCLQRFRTGASKSLADSKRNQRELASNNDRTSPVRNSADAVLNVNPKELARDNNDIIMPPFINGEPPIAIINMEVEVECECLSHECADSAV